MIPIWSSTFIFINALHPLWFFIYLSANTLLFLLVLVNSFILYFLLFFLIKISNLFVFSLIIYFDNLLRLSIIILLLKVVSYDSLQIKRVKKGSLCEWRNILGVNCSYLKCMLSYLYNFRILRNLRYFLMGRWYNLIKINNYF
jgi:hypothetical protein